jgi:hypothetical protein
VPETGAIKNPDLAAGYTDQFLGDVFWVKSLSRVSIRSPRLGTFFRLQQCARVRDHHDMMIVGSSTVNNGDHVATHAKNGLQKKAGLERARLEVLAT